MFINKNDKSILQLLSKKLCLFTYLVSTVSEPFRHECGSTHIRKERILVEGITHVEVMFSSIWNIVTLCDSNLDDSPFRCI